MLTCPVCLKSVESFKTNSHVFPRWVLKEIKTNGQNILITPNGGQKNQTDFKGDFICESCENSFATDDGIGAAIIRDKSALKKTFLAPNEGVEAHDVELAKPFIKFSLSILLRTHLYLLSTNQSNLLGPYFEKIRKMYVGESPSHKILIFRDVNLKLCVFPQAQKLGSCTTQEYAILGYRVVHILKERDLAQHFNSFFINENQFNVITSDMKETHWYRGLAAHAQAKRFPRF